MSYSTSVAMPTLKSLQLELISHYTQDWIPQSPVTVSKATPAIEFPELEIKAEFIEVDGKLAVQIESGFACKGKLEFLFAQHDLEFVTAKETTVIITGETLDIYMELVDALYRVYEGL